MQPRGVGVHDPLMTCATVLLVEAVLPPSPPYVAATLCVPTASELIEHTAERELPLPVTATAPHPASDTAPSLKLTVPVGALPVTVAVKTTVTPLAAGFGALPRAVEETVGPAGLTTCERMPLADDVLPASPA